MQKKESAHPDSLQTHYAEKHFVKHSGTVLRGLLNPVQEVTAAEKRVQNGFSTRANETMEMTGTDYYENCRQLEQEEKRLKGVKDIANSTAGEPATGK